MRTEHSAIPRHALVSLLTQAEEAAAAADVAKARSLLSDLHWFAHADPELHRSVHRLELELARRRGDVRGALGQVLPNAFARLVSFVESFGPSHEVVQSIEAPRELVYRIVADVASYAEWNPWVVGGHGGPVRVGDEIAMDVRLGKRQMRVGHRVLVASPPERFGWCDLGWFTPLASGRRLRWLEPSPEGTRYISQIRLYGPFAHLAWRLHGPSIRAGMADEASALARHAAVLARAAAPQARGASPGALGSS
jgi:Protein of unknown function (DUF3703)